MVCYVSVLDGQIRKTYIVRLTYQWPTMYTGLTMLYVTGVLIRSYRNNRKLWNNGGICGPPSEIIKKSNPPVEINHSNDHTPLLLGSKGSHTIRQSML